MDREDAMFTVFALKRLLKYTQGTDYKGERCISEKQYCPALWDGAMLQDVLKEAIRCVRIVNGLEAPDEPV